MTRVPSVDALLGRSDVHSLGVGAGNGVEKGGEIPLLSDSFAVSSSIGIHAAEEALSGAHLSLNVNQPILSGLSWDSYEEVSGQGLDRVDTSFSPRQNNPDGQSNFTSDDDQLVIDEMRQKRMISNRESARRSRLHKQQHLDELRSQIAHLLAENTHMLNRFNLASQQFAQLTEENCILRSNATDLRHQLLMLHHATFGHRLLCLEPLDLSSVQPLPLNLSLCSILAEDANMG